MRNLLQILNEAAADYEAMINPVLAAVRSNPRTGTSGVAVDLADEWREKIKKLWSEQVKNAKADLRKADRVTWYLRLVRARLIDTFASALDDAKINKVRQDYDNRAGLPIKQDGFYMTNNDALQTLTHYLSLPIPAIQNYQFRFQSYNEVKGDFQEFEDKWKETVKNTIEDNDSKVIIDCGNNWFWVNTEKAYCSKESAAMGHCGNSPRQYSNDQLLSLRKKIMFGQEVRWEPHLTFILADDGYLTEMKGKGNEKPTEKYHPMIIKLLKNDIIHGIRGGGYLPENNFSLDDLSDEQREALIEQKPELGTVLDLYNKLGVCDEVFNRVMEELRALSLECEEYEGDTVTLESWDDIGAFFSKGLYDDEGDRLVMIGDGDFDGWLDMKNENPEAKIEALIEAFDESDDDTFGDVLSQIADKIGVRRESAIKALVHMFPNSISAIWEEVENEVKQIAADAARNKVTGMRLRCYDDLNIEDDGRVTITMPFNSLVHNIASYQEQDYDTTDGFEYCAQDGSWLAREDDADEYYGDNDVEDVSPATVMDTAAHQAVRHILDLFHDENQLSFDF